MIFAAVSNHSFLIFTLLFILFLTSLSLSCGMQDFHYDMWDLSLWSMISLWLRHADSFAPQHVGSWASQVALVVKNFPAIAGDIRGWGSIPGSGRFPRGGHSNPLQYSCLENPIDRRAWWARVHGVTKSLTQLKWLSMHMWDLSSLTRDQTHVPCTRRQILNHWNTREVLQ